MKFVLTKQRIISGVTTFVFALILCVLTMGGTAYSKVCFLPDDSDCASGTTTDFWPGSSGGNTGDGSACDASFNSTSSRNECGETCVKCTDNNSKYKGLYKCPPNNCNCNGFTSVDDHNACGDACELCTIAGDKNYGKYKCPPATTPCNQCEEECQYTEADTATQLASDPCMECEPCNNQYCEGKWRCAINQACKTCRDSSFTLTPDEMKTEYDESLHTNSITKKVVEGCYEKACTACGTHNEQKEWHECHKLTAMCSDEYSHSASTLSDTDKTRHCYDTCDICYDDAHYQKYKCDCLGYDYTDDLCGSGKEAVKTDNTTCKGKGGTWYNKCCNSCSDCLDSEQTGAGWSCSEVTNACPYATTRYKCTCTRTATCGTSKGFGDADTDKRDSAAWSETTCEDCSGTYYKYTCATGYHSNSDGGCSEDCNVSCSAVTIPDNAHGTTTCQALNSDCTNNGDPVYTAWECDTGYHSDGNNGCTQDCSVTCTAVTIPENAHGTTTCQALNSDCSNNGDPVYTAWACDEGYETNSAGDGCQLIQTCEDVIADYTNLCNTSTGDAGGTVQEVSGPVSEDSCNMASIECGGKYYVCYVNGCGESCSNDYPERKDPNISEAEFVFNWIYVNKGYWDQDCDPDEQSQQECAYSLSYGTPLSDGTQCVKVNYTAPTCTVRTCSAVNVPSGAECTSRCTPVNSDCSTGSSVCTNWGCKNGYKKNSAGTGCTCEAYTGLTECNNSSYVKDGSHFCHNTVDNCYIIFCNESNGYYEDERDCEQEYGQGECHWDQAAHCYAEGPEESGGGGYYCDCPEGWHACTGTDWGPNTQWSGTEGHGSDGNRCDCCKD